MVTWGYWILVVLVLIGVLFLVGVKLAKWKVGIVLALALGVASIGMYYFYFEQIFVKRWGGTMSISLSQDVYHIGATWKGDNLWIENYDPRTNECIFSEYSRGNLLEGTVILKNCRPLIPGVSVNPR